MGQYNLNTGPGINPQVNKDITISILINSIHYFIECVFILHFKDKYRLVVLQHSRVLFDMNYSTERGCRIAFGKIFKDKAWDKRVTPQWSHFYDPDKDWLGGKLKPLKAYKNRWRKQDEKKN
jgi:hypothetical protein